jgi:hypothetical protein
MRPSGDETAFSSSQSAISICGMIHRERRARIYFLPFEGTFFPAMADIVA